MVRAATKPGTTCACQPRHPAPMAREAATDRRPDHDEFVGCSTPRNLKTGAYTVVWLTLSLDPIDRKQAST